MYYILLFFIIFISPLGAMDRQGSAAASTASKERSLAKLTIDVLEKYLQDVNNKKIVFNKQTAKKLLSNAFRAIFAAHEVKNDKNKKERYEVNLYMLKMLFNQQVAEPLRTQIKAEFNQAATQAMQEEQARDSAEQKKIELESQAYGLLILAQNKLQEFLNAVKHNKKSLDSFKNELDEKLKCLLEIYKNFFPAIDPNDVYKECILLIDEIQLNHIQQEEIKNSLDTQFNALYGYIPQFVVQSLEQQLIGYFAEQLNITLHEWLSTKDTALVETRIHNALAHIYTHLPLDQLSEKYDHITTQAANTFNNSADYKKLPAQSKIIFRDLMGNATRNFGNSKCFNHRVLPHLQKSLCGCTQEEIVSKLKALGISATPEYNIDPLIEDLDKVQINKFADHFVELIKLFKDAYPNPADLNTHLKNAFNAVCNHQVYKNLPIATKEEAITMLLQTICKTGDSASVADMQLDDLYLFLRQKAAIEKSVHEVEQDLKQLKLNLSNVDGVIARWKNGISFLENCTAPQEFAKIAQELAQRIQTLDEFKTLPQSLKEQLLKQCKRQLGSLKKPAPKVVKPSENNFEVMAQAAQSITEKHAFCQRYLQDIAQNKPTLALEPALNDLLLFFKKNDPESAQKIAARFVTQAIFDKPIFATLAKKKKREIYAKVNELWQQHFGAPFIQNEQPQQAVAAQTQPISRTEKARQRAQEEEARQQLAKADKEKRLAQEQERAAQKRKEKEQSTQAKTAHVAAPVAPEVDSQRNNGAQPKTVDQNESAKENHSAAQKQEEEARAIQARIEQEAQEAAAVAHQAEVELEEEKIVQQYVLRLFFNRLRERVKISALQRNIDTERAELEPSADTFNKRILQQKTFRVWLAASQARIKKMKKEKNKARQAEKKAQQAAAQANAKNTKTAITDVTAQQQPTAEQPQQSPVLIPAAPQLLQIDSGQRHRQPPLLPQPPQPQPVNTNTKRNSWTKKIVAPTPTPPQHVSAQQPQQHQQPVIATAAAEPQAPEQPVAQQAPHYQPQNGAHANGGAAAEPQAANLEIAEIMDMCRLHCGDVVVDPQAALEWAKNHREQVFAATEHCPHCFGQAQPTQIGEKWSPGFPSWLYYHVLGAVPPMNLPNVLITIATIIARSKATK